MDLPVVIPEGAAEVHVVPLEVNTFPLVPGATTWNADVPLPSRTLLAVKVAAPVPPAATGRVPAVSAEDEVEYSALFAAVKVVRPVPPFVVASVPARVTAPDVADEGVKPVVPALKVVTPSATLDATLA